MTPDFSPKMLRGFVNARIVMAGFRETFPDDRKGQRRPGCTFEAACEREKARIMRKADVTAEQLDLVLSGRVIGCAARERLWRTLGADPASFGIRLVGTSAQERAP